MKLPSEMTNNNKIFEFLRGLQKEAEAFNNDFGQGDECVADFCNTVYYYVDEIRSILNGEEDEAKDLIKRNKALKEMAEQSGVFEDYKIKKCILCDMPLPSQQFKYPTNHYLCSSECTQYYLGMSTWNKKMKTFILNEEILNEYRLNNGKTPIDKDEIDKRIDRVVIKDEG